MITKQAVNLSLDIIGKNGMNGIACEAASLPDALKSIGLDKLTPRTLSRITAELRRQGLIEITKDGKFLQLQLSVKGIHRLQRAHIDAIKISEPAEWDHLWRMVTYDVPRSYNAQRRLFTVQLKRLGFVMVRESVWFHKDPAFDAVLELARYCNIQRYITLAEVTRLDQVSLNKLNLAFKPLA